MVPADDDDDDCDASDPDVALGYDPGDAGGCGLVEPETEALLVTQDQRGRRKPRSTVSFEEEYEGEPV